MFTPIYQGLMKIFKIDHLLENDKDRILKEFEELMIDITINFILSSLSDDDARKFLSLMETSSEDLVAPINFAKEKIPDLEKKLALEIKKEIERIKKKTLKYGRNW